MIRERPKVGALVSEPSWLNPKSKETDVKALYEENLDYNRLIRSGCRVLCVSEDNRDAFKIYFHTRAYGKPRMWAQYGGNHTGVCLVLDKLALDKAIREACGVNDVLMSGKVDYGDFFSVSNSTSWGRHMEAFSLSGDQIVTDGLEKTLERHRDEFADVFFFQKSKDWEAENEYRWIIRGDSDNPIFLDIGSSLSAILLGTDFPQDRLGEVHDFCAAYKSYVGRVIWINGQPFVDWVPPGEVTTYAYSAIAKAHRLLS